MQVAMSSYSGVGVYFHPASTNCEECEHCNICMKIELYLFNFAFPALLTLMRPFICKSCSPGLNHPSTGWIFLAEISVLLFDCRHNRPSAIRRMFEMFRQGIVIFFPSIERFMAEETGDVVRIDLKWIVEESCSCKLYVFQYNSS